MRDVPNIDEVVDLLGLERNPRSRIGAATYMVKCPFCGDDSSHKYHMKIDTTKGVYHCYTCGQGQRGTGTLDLYARVRMGMAHQKGQNGNGKEILDRLLADLGRGTTDGANQTMRRNPRPKAPVIPETSVAGDIALNRAYSFMFGFPEFALEPGHKEKLLKRGLDEAAIQWNGYASMPKDLAWISKYREYGKIYDDEGLEQLKGKYDKTASLSKGRIIAGLIVAGEMQKAGISPKGVPGTFKLGKRWCMMYIPGMLIPTRNRNGQIVAVQTRMDKGPSRYLTLSASGLPYGVATNISRAHFPLGNAKQPQTAEVLCTEGPLKADVAVHLYGAPVFIIALHGVNNVRELSAIFRTLAIEGVTKVGNAFDMDKLCNTNVRESSKGLAGIIRKAGLTMYQKCWDADYAKTKWTELHTLCKANGVTVEALSKNVFVQIAQMADALKQAKVPFCIKTVGKKEEKDYWTDATKGLDDYLLSLRLPQ